ncbi:MAG TPA: TIGR04282 family arsenosugar biosynthesis glycosyltransferase [Stellaceae bacterium]|nr:TIGR04282 family arsenosugar biosynthesis glycosyltransferase [Stellaceae bacterium]
MMAKAPKPGAVKTRLVPPLTLDQASGLTRAFIGDIAHRMAATPASLWLAHGPDDVPTDFDGLLPPGFDFLVQHGADLGARMADLIERRLAAGASSVCLIGSDLPSLPAEILVEALRLLDLPGDRAVLGPAVDGGYYLIGLKRPHPGLFDRMVWSTPTVMAETLGRAASLALPTASLSMVEDIDDPAALDRLARRLTVDPSLAPRTATFLAALETY